MEPNEERHFNRPFNAKTLVFGLLVIALGLAWLLRNTGVLSESAWDIIFSWEMLLIALGVVFLFNESGKFWGFLLIAIGGFFLLSDIYDFPTTFRKVFWPALLIIGGIYLIWGARRITRKREIPEGALASDYIDEVSIFSGGEKRFSSDQLRGGQMVSIFGGSTIDLTQCKLADYAELDTTSIFGGFTLVVPAGWNVRLEVTHIFGGVSDKRPQAEVDKSKTLVIKGTAIFGGGEIKSY